MVKRTIYDWIYLNTPWSVNRFSYFAEGFWIMNSDFILIMYTSTYKCNILKIQLISSPETVGCLKVNKGYNIYIYIYSQNADNRNKDKISLWIQSYLMAFMYHVATNYRYIEVRQINIELWLTIEQKNQTFIVNYLQT